jgi:trans-aconitate 2-methyltransferase
MPGDLWEALAGTEEISDHETRARRCQESSVRGAISMDAKTFYDEYVDRQSRVGVNERHRSIVRWLKRAGLRRDQRVLEIGCGIGTLTQLLVDEVSEGSILALDLSPKSIEMARSRLASASNVHFEAADVLTLDLSEQFNIVVLPDVIEHIPLELHGALFERIAAWLEPDGFALAHYPNPHYQDWLRDNRPDLLQVIDQAVEADALLSHAYASGLYLDFLETYSIWIREGDYVVAVFRPKSGVDRFTELPERRPSLLSRGAARLRRRRR